MKKISKIVVQFIVVMGLIMTFTNIIAFAKNGETSGAWLPGTDTSVNAIYEEAALPVPDSSNSDELIKEVVMGALSYTKVIVVALGILFITIMGFELLMNSSNEEKVTNVRKGMTYILIAFVMISMSQDIAKIFDFQKTTLLQSPTEMLKRVQIWDKQVEILIKFIKYIIASFAFLMIVKNSLTLVTSGGDDEKVTKSKHGILFSIAGLLLVYGGDIFINKVFYVVNKRKYTGTQGIDWKVNAGQGVKEIVGITNMAVSFVAPLAILMLVIAAGMYLGAGGEEETMNKAKRIIVATIIGIVIVYGAFAIVSTVVAGKLPTDIVPVQNV